MLVGVDAKKKRYMQLRVKMYFVARVSGLRRVISPKAALAGDM
jgi:hypothetical protein